MRKLGLGLLVAAVMAFSIWAYADVTLKQNGSDVGRVEVLSQKNGNVISVSRSGELGTVGINWTDFRAYASTYGDHSGINWQSLGV